jgi:serine/threonine-protein kinase RsbW
MHARSDPVGFADGRWEQRAGAFPESIAPLREAVVAFAALHGVGPSLRDDIALAVSEALTNAVVHGFVGGPVGTLWVIATTVGDALVVRVLDDGRGMIARTDSPGLGFGMSIMAALASDLDVRERPGGRGTEVRLAFAGCIGAPAGGEVRRLPLDRGRR